MSLFPTRWWHEHGRCSHRSHRLRLPCLRGWRYDYRCARHNRICWPSCEDDLR